MEHFGFEPRFVPPLKEAYPEFERLYPQSPHVWHEVGFWAQSRQELDTAADEAAEAMREHVIPFFERYRTIQALDEGLDADVAILENSGRPQWHDRAMLNSAIQDGPTTAVIVRACGQHRQV